MMVYSALKNGVSGDDMISGRLSIVAALSLLSPDNPVLTMVTLGVPIYRSNDKDIGVVFSDGQVEYHRSTIMLCQKIGATKSLAMLYSEFDAGATPLCSSGHLLHKHWLAEKGDGRQTSDLVLACLQRWITGMDWRELAVLINPTGREAPNLICELDEMLYQDWLSRLNNNFVAAWGDLGPLFRSGSTTAYLQAGCK